MLGWFFILAAIPVTIATGSRSAAKIASASWPQAIGQVTSSEIVQRRGKQVHWCIELSYRYIVDGTSYDASSLSTSRIHNAACDRSKQAMAARLETLRPGQRIPIRYKPDEPQRAIVHVAQLDLLDYFFAGLAGMLVLGGVSTIRWGKTLRSEQGRRLSATASDF